MSETAERKKRSRATNMSTAEKALLAELGVQYATVIENKQTDALSAKAKEAAWKQLATDFVSSGGERRDWLQLKHVSPALFHDKY